MWAFARYEIGLKSDEFYAMTPRQFHALADQYRWNQERSELLFAQLAAVTHNTGFRTTEKPLEVQDFMPSRWGAAAKKRSRRMSRKKIADGVRAAMGAWVKQ